MTKLRKLSQLEVLDRVEDYIAYNGPNWLVEASNHSYMDMQSVCINLGLETYWHTLYSAALNKLDISENGKGEFHVIG